MVHAYENEKSRTADACSSEDAGTLQEDWRGGDFHFAPGDCMHISRQVMVLHIRARHAVGLRSLRIPNCLADITVGPRVAADEGCLIADLSRAGLGDRDAGHPFGHLRIAV